MASLSEDAIAEEVNRSEFSSDSDSSSCLNGEEGYSDSDKSSEVELEDDVTPSTSDLKSDIQVHDSWRDKWWKYLFAFVVNTAIVNSFILYKETNSPSNTRHGVTQKNFRLALYRQMIGKFSSRKVIGRKRILPMSTFSQRQQHSLVKIVGRKKVCAYCSSKKRKTPAGRSIETSWKCIGCDLPLCKLGCYLQYHQENGVELGH